MGWRRTPTLYPPALYLSLLIALLFGFQTTTTAQLVPCAGAVTPVNAGSFTATIYDDIVVNADMLQIDNSGHTIKAIAYGRRSFPTMAGTGSAAAYVYAEDWAGNSVTFALSQPNASRPDIVLATDDEQHNKPGSNPSYKVVVVYQSGGDIYYDVWRLEDCGLSTMHVSSTPVMAIGPINTGGNTTDDYHNGPHIDMWSDANSLDAIGLPTMHKFAIVWTDGVHATASCTSPPVPTSTGPLLPYNLELYIGDAATGFIGNFSLGYGAYMPDVACLTDNTVGGDDMAEITFTGDPCSGGGLELTEFDLTSPPATPSALVSTATALDNGDVFSPRIEAMSQYNGNAARWQIAAAVHKSSFTPTFHIMGYNNLSSPTWLSSMYFSAADSDVKAPCVAAGINLSYSSDIGNAQYTTGFFPRIYQDLIERMVYPASGTVNSQWWQVNCMPVYYDWDAARSMAVTNCSNSGFNLLTAWYDGSDIIYKESPNAMTFKKIPTGTGGKEATVLYPNPATEELHLGGVQDGTQYRISDISGRMLLSGSLIYAGDAIDVRSLAAGMYMLSVQQEESGAAQTLKFTRQ